MNEVRIILVGFGILGTIMIGLPILSVFTASKMVPDAQAETGAIAKLFRGAEPAPSGRSARPLKNLATVLPLGTSEAAAYDTLHASGFRCEPDAGSAACFRSTRTAAMCEAEWRVRMTFDAQGHITASDALDTTACP